jgi:ribose transport system ATP-binding protein
MTGSVRLLGGEIRVDGEHYAPRRPGDALAAGIGSVPSDRVRDGLALDMAIRENLFLDGRVTGTRHVINRRVETQEADEILRTALVRPADPEAQVATLSGGNMQKVLVAKWLRRASRLLVLSEPTVGVDVGARSEIYERIYAAARGGIGVLLISSDFEEIATLCQRVHVVRFGRQIAELEGDQVTAELLTILSAGGSQKGGERAR